MNDRLPVARLAFAFVTLTALSVGFGCLQATGAQIPDSLGLFAECWSNLVPLLFPILLAVYFLPALADEFSNGGTQAVRTRMELGNYIRRRVLSAAGTAFIVFFAAVLVSWVFAFHGAPHFAPDLLTPPEPGETVGNPEQRYRFSSILSVHPFAFGLFYAAWLGVNAAALTAAGAAALVWVPNRFVAMAVPFVVYWGLTVPPAVLRLESFASSMAIFPFSLDQVPAWHALPQLGLVVGGVVLALQVAHLRNFETAGLA